MAGEDAQRDRLWHSVHKGSSSPDVPSVAMSIYDFIYKSHQLISLLGIFEVTFLRLICESAVLDGDHCATDMIL